MPVRASVLTSAADMLQRLESVEAISHAPFARPSREASLTEAENNYDPEKTILGIIHILLERRGASGLEVLPESRLTADLGLDSLELAELSAALEDDLGNDPYSEGIVPETVGNLVGFYAN